MSEYLLRLEGVNLASVLEDTNQLSVIRGGSLLLRQSIHDIADHFSKLEPISSGASAGLFRLEANAQEVEQIRDDIAAYLNCDPHYRHLTFVVDIQPADKKFTLDSEAVLARNRFRQLQQPTLALPPHNEGTDVAPCKWDGLRPGTVLLEVMRDDKRPSVSTSVQQRHNYGRDQKQSFYRRETTEPTLASLRFTNDLQDLSENSPVPNLGDKLAIIYLDGNGFTKLREAYCHTAKALEKFDNCIQQYRRQFLTVFLQHIKDDLYFKTDVGLLRLETLLWGGDEMTLVVPAWKGLQTLYDFYTQSERWNFEGEPLTHAGGLVFCKAKTPIYRMQRLARELADHVKDRIKGQPADAKNRYEYIVLESIDYPTEPITDYWQRRFVTLAGSRQPLRPILSWEGEAGMEKHVGALLEQIPKTQVHALVQAALQGNEAFVKQQERFKAVITEKTFSSIEAELQALFPGNDPFWPWLHLYELWDYLAPEWSPPKN